MKREFIVGDVVMYDYKIMVIKEPRDGSHFDLSCPKEGLVYCFVSVEDMKPVRLTEEILKKNGWEKRLGVYYVHPIYNKVIHVDSHDPSEYDVLMGIFLEERMFCVSDLQHYLSRKGYKSEMEV